MIIPRMYCNNTRVRVVLARYTVWLFPSRVNLHATLRENFGFHGKLWQSTREWLRGATRGTSRVCEVVVKRYRSMIGRACLGEVLNQVWLKSIKK